MTPSPAVSAEQVLPVVTPNDIIVVRRAGRELAEKLGFSGTDVTLVATAISEVLRNIVEHAGGGTVTLAIVRERGREGILVIADDGGPGIEDLELAMSDGWSSNGSMGMGLPGARRLVDEFHLRSAPGEGTTIRMVKWAPQPETTVLFGSPAP
jgi:serine/threonine-protein kinase RsbT